MRYRSVRNGVNAVRNVKEIVVAALALTVIAAVAVAALAGTNLLTRDAIAENERAASAKACMAAFPAPDTSTVYTYTEMEDVTLSDGVLAAFEVKNGDELVGYVVKTSTKGKSKNFVMMTGVTADGTIRNLSLVSQSETAGYVNKVADVFANLVGKNTDTQMQVDTVSNATKTSNAVLDGARLALATVKEVQANG